MGALQRMSDGMDHWGIPDAINRNCVKLFAHMLSTLFQELRAKLPHSLLDFDQVSLRRLM